MFYQIKWNNHFEINMKDFWEYHNQNGKTIWKVSNKQVQLQDTWDMWLGTNSYLCCLGRVFFCLFVLQMHLCLNKAWATKIWEIMTIKSIKWWIWNKKWAQSIKKINYGVFFICIMTWTAVPFTEQGEAWVDGGCSSVCQRILYQRLGQESPWKTH